MSNTSIITPIDDANRNDLIPKVGKFEKVTFEEYKAAMDKHFNGIFDEEIIKSLYESIKLPKRATKDSAGYDFFTPISFKPSPASGIVIPTGIRSQIAIGWVLKIYPRSGQGFKYGVQLYNSTGIIDGDYYFSDNEGHIMVKISAKEKADAIKQGTGFCQGIFTPYGITIDDDVTELRNGGFGSTTDKK